MSNYVVMVLPDAKKFLYVEKWGKEKFTTLLEEIFGMSIEGFVGLVRREGMQVRAVRSKDDENNSVDALLFKSQYEMADVHMNEKEA